MTGNNTWENDTWLKQYISVIFFYLLILPWWKLEHSMTSVLCHVSIHTHNAKAVLRSLCVSVGLSGYVRHDTWHQGGSVWSIFFFFRFCWSMKKWGGCSWIPLKSQGYISTTAVCLVFIVWSDSLLYVRLNSMINVQRDIFGLVFEKVWLH